MGVSSYRTAAYALFDGQLPEDLPQMLCRRPVQSPSFAARPRLDKRDSDGQNPTLGGARKRSRND
jgi:hypothetical protein